MLHSPTFTSKHGDADSHCLAGCSMKMNFVRTMRMQEKNILTVYTFLVLMIEEIKYSIEKKSVVSNVMKERMTYLSYYTCNFSFEKTAKENGRLM